MKSSIYFFALTFIVVGCKSIKTFKTGQKEYFAEETYYIGRMCANRSILKYFEPLGYCDEVRISMFYFDSLGHGKRGHWEGNNPWALMNFNYFIDNNEIVFDFYNYGYKDTVHIKNNRRTIIENSVRLRSRKIKRIKRNERHLDLLNQLENFDDSP